VLRRSEAREPEDVVSIRLTGWEVDVASLSASSASKGSVRFTKKEMDVLLYLASNQDRPVPREELLAKVWGYVHAELIETRTVDIHIAKIRKKIEDDSSQPKLLQTVRGAGYRLTTTQ
jgi:two-component system response regulator RegX3